MSYRTRETTAYLFMMDTDWVVTIEYEFINYGTSGSYYSPAEGPDYDICRIWLSRDERDNEGPKWEATGEMFYNLAGRDNINTAVIDDINSY